jgi:chloride channel 7
MCLSDSTCATTPRHFRNDADKRDFVAIGTATGVAVAFGAPIGGMLFTLEEGASFHSTAMLWRGFLATCMAVLTRGLLDRLLDVDATEFLRAKVGTHRDFGLYTDDEADYSRVYWWYVWEVPIFACMGCLCGLFGALFVNTNVKLTMFRHKYIPVSSKWKRLAEVIFVCATTATIMFVMMAVSPCRDVPSPLRNGAVKLAAVDLQPASFEYGVESKDNIRDDFFRSLYCPEGQYSSYGQLFYVPLAESFKFLLHLGGGL